jgi:hypothetical protein
MVATEPVRVTCGFCRTTFLEDRGQATCEACPLSKACGFVRCPECGYENPRAPQWLETVRRWVGR